MQIAFPFRIDHEGFVARADYDSHVRDMIEQVLFTSPGERVNRPDFGCGLAALVFESPNHEMTVATQALVQGALQQWLGDVIRVEEVTVELEESRLVVFVAYTVLSSGLRTRSAFERPR